MLRSTRRGLETWHGRDRVTLADERARQQGTQTSTYTGAPVLDPTSTACFQCQFFCSQFVRFEQRRGEIDPATAATSPDRLTEIRRYRGRAGSSFPFLPRRSALIPNRTLTHGSPWLRASEATRVRRRQINGLGRFGRVIGVLTPIEQNTFKLVLGFALDILIPRRCR